MKRNIKRRGFTLVELLIVIVVIGILSAMMMLSSTEAVTSAKASNIVSNLRNLKTAALAMYIDSMDQFDAKDSTLEPTIDRVVKYLNGGTDIPDKSNYGIEKNDQGWFLSYEITGTGAEKSQIKEKLTGRAKSVGLLAAAQNTSKTEKVDGKDVTTAANPYTGQDKVYYFVR